MRRTAAPAFQRLSKVWTIVRLDVRVAEPIEEIAVRIDSN